ncbi:uncharacterized protein EI90DRAFT_3034107 [Cantharellus anzutake]|uniref:uncharacterized protein n=1 Tax=Cantharellus anzutake TaxID=1750568 RepID=UPI0019044F4F|nr:uncharacterized protein EI90DRAFT_3034107 [Cantharellus anzutake]KAF8341489.1 hypothetical protein EI90DRAFT_3034107 [Cantharellus anzutake]
MYIFPLDHVRESPRSDRRANGGNPRVQTSLGVQSPPAASGEHGRRCTANHATP